MSRYSILLILFVFNKNINGLAWNTSGLCSWESYLQLGEIERPLGLTLDRSSIVHHHFYIGYLCLHSFLYDEAQDAFDSAIELNETFIEAYIGKLLGYKQALWASTNFIDAQKTYNTTIEKINSSNLILTDIQSKLLKTVQQWYIDPTNTTVGEDAFLPLIANLSSSYPNETDFLALYGLSLLNIADQAQFQSQMEPAKMLDARNILTDALRKEPNHPGLLHYLIHAYDVTQVNISQQAEQYALTYGNIVKTASHAQHMPSHIWMRTGSWNRAVSADGSGIIASFGLCSTKILGEIVNVSSTSLSSVLSLFNGSSNQTQTLLKCDAENRAHSLEWLVYSRLQTGDWSGSISLLADIFTADTKSVLTPNHYLPFAYRTQARTIIELFFWFPYQDTFRQRTKQILALNGTKTLVSLGLNATRWYPMWSEAAIRFSECLQLLLINTTINNNNSLVDEHLDRIAVLSNQSKTYNQYVSNSTSMMINQIRGIRYYINQDYQNCLNELNAAVQYENELIGDANTPTLIFARSSELLAMHLLLIYSKYQNQTGKTSVASNYTLNGANVSVLEFPSRALSLSKSANVSAPNRAINTLGLARAYIQANNRSEAVRYYKILFIQMNSSNNSDTIFLDEARTNINNYNSINTNSNSNFIYPNFVLFIFFFVFMFQQ